MGVIGAKMGGDDSFNWELVEVRGVVLALWERCHVQCYVSGVA